MSARMVNIPLPGLPDININLPDLPDLPDLPTVPGTDIPNVPGIGLWPAIPEIDVEKRFWDLIDDIDRLTLRHRLPVPRLRPILDQFSLIDSDKLREVAKVWGSSLADLGVPATVGADVPKKIDETLLTLTERWEGKAYTNFKQWMGELKGVVGQYGPPAHQVGAVLNDLADKYDLTKLEVIGAVTAAAGFVMAALAFAIPEPILTKGLALVMASIGAALAVIDVFITILDGAYPRIKAAKDAADTLTDEINRKIPLADDAHVRLPARGEWQPRTTDPYN